MIKVITSGERHHANMGWLSTHWHFSCWISREIQGIFWVFPGTVYCGHPDNSGAAGKGAQMAVAILTVHLPAGFFLPSGYEFALTLLAANAALAFLGSGEASLDRLLASRQS